MHEDAVAQGTLPGSGNWTPEHEWPVGHFGFVWGCHWGDDRSWKLQYLDLAGVGDGRLRREERFGYVPLETDEPMEPGSWRDPREFIEVWRDEGELRVRVRTQRTFDLVSGEETTASE